MSVDSHKKSYSSRLAKAVPPALSSHQGKNKLSRTEKSHFIYNESGGKGNDFMGGFGVMVPSIAKALKKSNGKMFPLGIFRMLGALKGKNDTLEMYFVAVDPQRQSYGVPAIIINTLLKNTIVNGIKYCETGPMLEINANVHSM